MKPDRVFAVDDDESYRALLALVLQTHCGVSEVRTFAGGEQAVAALCALAPGERPALLLLDFHMPGLDGLGVLRALADAGLQVPVVVLSNAAGEQEREACLAAGARDFLVKPVRVEELALILRLQLERNG